MKENINEIEQLKIQGYTYQQIASKFGITRQRVQQLTRPPRQTVKELKIRADYKCEVCRRPVNSRGHIHHKEIPDIAFNDLRNLQYLCVSCHLKTDTDQPAQPHGSAVKGAKISPLAG